MKLKNVFEIMLPILLCALPITAKSQGDLSAGKSTQTKEESMDTKFHAPYPFTAQELWANLLTIAAKFPESGSRENVEKMWGIKMVQAIGTINSRTELNPTVIEALDGRDWYFALSMDVEKSITKYFKFSWKHSPFGYIQSRPDSLCIDVNQIRTDLEKAGWKFHSKGHPERNDIFETRYKKSTNETLTLISAEGKDYACLYSMDLFSK
ncbi:hypothetical protein QN372_20385 [Undibacterium sp. RTI2.1]|uniref:hypothetical protein n=1 Tax=Undibacterium sp. RTI2.1 TaxID=3048637 RepID=UPI002B22B6A1|nr:hypothetical protein [Undibacterium sp. RTI2.1]MEB0033102.1 hypothetical protein [Undibacterium sp. RTI2.1]